MLVAAFQHEWLTLLALIPPVMLSNGVELYQIKDADDVSSTLVWPSDMQAVVVRGGRIQEISIVDLVPGDVVHISEVTLKLSTLSSLTSAVRVKQFRQTFELSS